MIQHLEITGVHMQVGNDLRKYITKKMNRLERFVPKNARESLHIQITVSESKKRSGKECICEAVVHLPRETFTVKEGTVNIFAAVDIVEEKLRGHFKKYKELHANPRLHQRMLTHLKRRPVNDTV